MDTEIRTLPEGKTTGWIAHTVEDERTRKDEKVEYRNYPCVSFIRNGFPHETLIWCRNRETAGLLADALNAANARI